MPSEEICESVACSCSGVTRISAASSSSVGLRCSTPSSFMNAFSSARAFARTERGTQSIDRSSSRIAPLIRAMA